MHKSKFYIHSHRTKPSLSSENGTSPSFSGANFTLHNAIFRLYIAHLCRQSGNQHTNGAGTRFYAYTCCALGHETSSNLGRHTRVYGTATKFAGTPGFQAPEKLQGESVTTGVDIYSVGGNHWSTSLQGHGPTHDNVQSLC